MNNEKLIKLPKQVEEITSQLESIIQTDMPKLETKIDTNIFNINKSLSSMSNNSYKDKVYMNEMFRPQYHFSPTTGFMNDPNGLVYLNGYYHLFYQYEPNKLISGFANWGHARSKDLIKWERLPIALKSETEYAMWSGCCVVDKNNTAGFGANALICLYTAYKKTDGTQSQCLAYSLDDGYTFTKYVGNPIIPSSIAPNGDATKFRDPKVIWHEESNKWVMVLACSKQVGIYTSSDLKSWTYKSSFTSPINVNELFECPNLFKLKLDGTSYKWILVASWGMQQVYWVGDFNGTTFVADNPNDYPNYVDVGSDFYALTTWNNSPDNEVYGIGWINNWDYCDKLTPVIYENKFNGSFSIPRKLKLKTINGKVKLINELISLISNPFISYKNETMNGVEELYNSKEIIIDSVFDFANTTSTEVGFYLFDNGNEKVTLKYEVGTSKLTLDRSLCVPPFMSKTSVGYLLKQNNKIKLKVLCDRNSIEVIGNDGELSMTQLVFPYVNGTKTSVYSNGSVNVNIDTGIVPSTWISDTFRTNLDRLDFSSNIFKKTENGLEILSNIEDNRYLLSKTFNIGDNFTYSSDFIFYNLENISLIFKCDSTFKNMYGLHLNNKLNRVHLTCIENGVERIVNIVPNAGIIKNENGTIRIQCSSQNIKVFLNGNKIIDVNENNLAKGFFAIGVYNSVGNEGSAILQNTYVAQ